MSEKQFSLTLDLENDWYFDDPGYDHLTFEYIDEFVQLISGLDLPLSVFVVGRTLEKHPDAVDRLASGLDCEFHLHSYCHESDGDFRTDLCRGKEVFRDHFGQYPTGYREPYGKIEPGQFPVLAGEGFEFDSSVFPSYRPGVYNNLDSPLEPYIPEGLSEFLEIPLGVFPGFRIPISQNYFKLFGRPLSAILSVAPLPDTLVYNVHLQDLFRTDSHNKLPRIKRMIIKMNLEKSETILEKNVRRILSRGYEPVPISEIHSTNVES